MEANRKDKNKKIRHKGNLEQQPQKPTSKTHEASVNSVSHAVLLVLLS